MSNPFEGDDWEAYAARVLTELVPAMRDSSVIVSLVPTNETDVKFAVELGVAIMLDKPIVAVVPAGCPVPGKLIAVADEIIEGSIDDPDLRDRFMAAMQKYVGKANGD